MSWGREEALGMPMHSELEILNKISRVLAERYMCLGRKSRKEVRNVNVTIHMNQYIIHKSQARVIM